MRSFPSIPRLALGALIVNLAFRLSHMRLTTDQRRQCRRVMRLLTFPLVSFLVLGSLSMSTYAQQPPSYGSPIQLDAASRIMQAATEEAKANDWPVAIAIYDSTAHLVMFHRLDNTQLGSVEIAMEKARTAVLYRRPTAFWEERLVEGGANLKVLKLPGIQIEGGYPITIEGKIVGSIGVSGVTSSQDAQVARAGLTAVLQQP